MTQTLKIDSRPGIEALEKTAPSYQAYKMLYALLIAVPLVAGADKFFHVLVNWDQYLSPLVTQITHIPAHSFMLGVGVIEIIAAMLVVVKPRIGSLVVAAWLAGIIVNLLMIPGYFDVAFRDFGLCLSAIAFFKLSSIHSR